MRFYLQLELAFGEGVTILTSPINKCIYTACWSNGMTIFLKTFTISRSSQRCACKCFFIPGNFYLVLFLGCTNELVTTENGLLANTNATSILGVDLQFEAVCTCGARDFTFVESPETCGVTSCLNGGTCHQPETWENM